MSAADTPRFIERLSPFDRVSSGSPVARPESGRVLTVGEVYRRLLPMVGSLTPILVSFRSATAGLLFIVRSVPASALTVSLTMDNSQIFCLNWSK